MKKKYFGVIEIFKEFQKFKIKKKIQRISKIENFNNKKIQRI